MMSSAGRGNKRLPVSMRQIGKKRFAEGSIGLFVRRRLRPLFTKRFNGQCFVKFGKLSFLYGCVLTKNVSLLAGSTIRNFEFKKSFPTEVTTKLNWAVHGRKLDKQAARVNLF